MVHDIILKAREIRIPTAVQMGLQGGQGDVVGWHLQKHRGRQTLSLCLTAGWETEFGEVKFSSILFELVISRPGPFSTNYTLSLFLADGCSHCVWFPLYFRACLIISFKMASTWECPMRHYCWSVTSSVRLMTSLMHSSMLEISFIITGSLSYTRFHVEIVLNILDLFQSIRQVWCQVFI